MNLPLTKMSSTSKYRFNNISDLNDALNPMRAHNKKTAGGTSHGLLAIPLALAAMLPVAGHTDELDTLQFRAGQSFQHDSNVYRLSDSTNTLSLPGRPERSDTIGITTFGVKFDKRYSLQRFEVDVFADRYDYKNNSRLNFTSKNYDAAWRWSLTPRLYGNLSADRREYVDNSADLQNLGQLNRRLDRTTLADAEYDLGGAWRVTGGFFGRDLTNSLANTFESDYSVQGAQAGARYVFPSGNWVGYRFKNGEGEYPGRTLTATRAKDFQDREHEFRALWMPTGKTTVRGRLSHLERSNEGLGARDFSGLTGQVDATWNATAKTAVMAGYVRELENYQTNTASYYAGNRFFVAPTYMATEKIAVRLRYDHYRREFKGALAGFSTVGRRDTLNLMSLSVDYQVIRALKLRAWVQRDHRDSTVTGLDYRSNAMGISALASF